ncbi:MAG TPA: S9 family peptidase [Steroidobacteraceae bacterium]|nr:S9 family peptidase [Steroidobacteraceae bacterium]
MTDAPPPAPPARALLLGAVCMCAVLAMAEAAGATAGAELSIDRLFDAPSLSGPSIQNVKISPDGTRVTYLKGREDNKDRLDLWAYDVESRQSRLLIDSRVLAPPEEHLSDEERSRRERQRTASLSGIIEYGFAPSGRALLFPLDGRLYYYDLTRPAREALLAVAPEGGFITDATVSPRGAYLAYVRDQNLYTYDLARRAETALTHDGGGPIKNGMAEFVAQEEMDRSTGYWWSPDERHIAFARVDETAVPLTRRFEIAADNVRTFEQRYPAAGGPNVTIRLGVADRLSGALTWIDLGPEQDIYLARVTWLPDGKTLAIQRESRDQHRLDLLFADIASGTTRTVLSEHSDTWIELGDELTFLRRSHEFIWASMRDGHRHLYLYETSGRLVRQLTAGDWDVDDFHGRAIKGIDERHRWVYFTATEKSPTERHLYRASLETPDPHEVLRISREDGLHAVALAPQARFYVDQFNSREQPLQVSLRDLDGRLIEFLLENRLDRTHPDAPYLADNAMPTFGTLTASDGQTLHYRLFLPPHLEPKRRYPALVEVYGGPGVQRVLNGWSGGTFTQILTRAGYIVFQLDNRGSAGRGTRFQAPIHGRLGEVELADQVLGARWLATQSYVDPDRIGVHGWSYGGYMTLMLLLKAPDLFKAGVAGAPVTDWTLYDTHYTERYLGTPQANAAGYAASSVLPYADRLNGALLVMHGMADDNVLFLHSTKLFRRLQDLGKPFETMVYPGGKHGLMREHDGRHGYATMLRFFDAHLKRSPD